MIFAECQLEADITKHHYLVPVCQYDGCDGYENSYPHPDDHIFAAPEGELIWGKNAYRFNVCAASHNKGDYYNENWETCDCRCHWGTYYVNIYELGQGYGGPEEGGWYYEYGEPFGSMPFDNLSEAQEFADTLREKYKDNHSRYSVLPRDTDYGVYIEKHFAESFPQVTPHYE